MFIKIIYNYIMGIGKKCIIKNCNLEASYNWQHLNVRKYCNNHKEDGMVNIVSITCIYPNCDRIALYNFKQCYRLGKYCSNHKLPNMVNVSNLPYCIVCYKRASFNFKNKKKPIYCAEHKDNEMIDITSRQCLKCDKRPSFNYKNEKKPMYCYTHKLPEMVDIKNPICLECNKRASFNFNYEKKPIYCHKHKLPEMINVVKKLFK